MMSNHNYQSTRTQLLATTGKIRIRLGGNIPQNSLTWKRLYNLVGKTWHIDQGFSTLGTTDILGYIIICCGGWGLFSSIPGLHPIDARTKDPSLSILLVTIRHCQMSPEGGKIIPSWERLIQIMIIFHHYHHYGSRSWRATVSQHMPRHGLLLTPF